MSKENPQKQNNPDARGNNVWLVLIAFVSGVMLIAFLFGRTETQMRYDDLITLLNKTAEYNAKFKATEAEDTEEVDTGDLQIETSDRPEPPKIVVKSLANPNNTVEFSRLNEIRVSEEMNSRSIRRMAKMVRKSELL